MQASITVHREKLYEEVWTTPLRRLAQRYGISDVALGKICRKLNVPRPGVGYWAKIEAGAPPGRIPLPAQASIIAIDIHPQPPASPETASEREKRLQREARIEQFAHIRVPAAIERLHPLTRSTREHFKDIERKLKRPQRSGPGLRSDWFSHPYDRNGRYSCLPSEGFNLLVSLDGVDRALRILDTLAKALEKYGFVLKANPEKRRLEVLKDKEVAAFELREGYKRIPLDATEVARKRAVQSWASDQADCCEDKACAVDALRERQSSTLKIVLADQCGDARRRTRRRATCVFDGPLIRFARQSRRRPDLRFEPVRGVA
jgi:hypothetical protein